MPTSRGQRANGKDREFVEQFHGAGAVSRAIRLRQLSAKMSSVVRCAQSMRTDQTGTETPSSNRILLQEAVRFD